jgi:hypothetical protein
MDAPIGNMWMVLGMDAHRVQEDGTRDGAPRLQVDGTKNGRTKGTGGWY